MVYPVTKPIVRPGILFDLEKRDTFEDRRDENDPDLHPLFGISRTQYAWPGYSEYQDNYCSGDDDGFQPHNQQSRIPWPCGPQIQARHRDTGCKEKPRIKPPKPFDQLYETTPLPLLDKHYRGYYYRINDPIGVVAKEEVTKCRDTAFGPQPIKIQEEMESTYLPNYRYKEWVQQPHINILNQLDMTSPLCRLPEPDTRHYDFYNRVRMNRPSPQITINPFSTCMVIPIPKDDPHFAS